MLYYIILRSFGVLFLVISVAGSLGPSSHEGFRGVFKRDAFVDVELT